MTNTMERTKKSVSDVINMLWDNESLFAVIGEDELTNRESIRSLLKKDNQDEMINLIENGDHLLIW